MLQEIGDLLKVLLGLGQDISNVGSFQMALRSILVYVFTLAIVRLGSKRFLAEATAFDVIVGIMLGSIMSRAINGSAPFFPTLAAGFILVVIHWLLGILSFYINWFGPLVKGNPVLLVKDGNIQPEGMRKAGLSNHDLEQSLRLQAKLNDPSEVKQACMERNGSISVIPYQKDPHILEVDVQDGVKTVRIEFD